MPRRKAPVRLFAAVSVLACLSLTPGSARAQLKGDYVAGSSGLQNGSQAPPGISVYLSAYFYRTDTIKEEAGDTVLEGPAITTIQLGPGVAWVTNVKVLGGHWGGQIQPVALAKSRTETNSLDTSTSFAFSDIFVQPLQLGWQTPRVDYTAGWGFFAPTGRWELGGSDNSGLGMWSYDYQAGSTLRLDERGSWTTSLLATFEMHTRKKSTSFRAGDILTLEGGTGRTFTKDIPGSRTATLGIVYYAQFKVSDDKGSGPFTDELLSGRRDRVYGAGVEGGVSFPKTNLNVGLRALPEFGARERTQGFTFQVNLSYQPL
jgi:hypothetical protein